jgi:hypothetical protein
MQGHSPPDSVLAHTVVFIIEWVQISVQPETNKVTALMCEMQNEDMPTPRSLQGDS